jgi:tellurite resistance protein
MASPVLLNAAARAFAMVSFSDGRFSPKEKSRFEKFVASEPALKPAVEADVGAAWALAEKEVLTAQSFGGVLVTVRTEVKTAADKAVVMRAAQAALVADEKDELQENLAIRTLAEALGLDPGKY